MGYLAGQCVFTNVTYVRTTTGYVVRVVSNGSYAGFPAQRNIVLRLANSVCMYIRRMNIRMYDVCAYYASLYR